MAYLIGIDEAGYGPFLGPLCIGATYWSIPDELFHNDVDLYPLLESLVTTTLKDKSRIMIGDSKLAYKPGGGLKNLERAIFPLLPTPISSFQQWMESYAVKWSDWSSQSPWFEDYDRPLPSALDEQTLVELKQLTQTCLANSPVRFLGAKVWCLPAHRFNLLLNSFPTKGALLSHCSLTLARQITEELPEGRVQIHCDKHGGRNQYSHILQQLFPEYLVEIYKEGREISSYAWGPAEKRVACRFVAKGESFLPAALASMYAKYTRELTMGAFNDWWAQHIPEIKPTAGYPQDAKRFVQEIQPLVESMKLQRDVLWRNS
ncbi:MAG: hypothetical protein CMJ76_10080 [Planctomycetaceae bacterium]|nr:hypothetical protein [Planctomycetaceae bacterium]